MSETAPSRWAATVGLPFPLGQSRIEDEEACNFALYSNHAESVTLLLYTTLNCAVVGFDSLAELAPDMRSSWNHAADQVPGIGGWRIDLRMHLASEFDLAGRERK